MPVPSAISVNMLRLRLRIERQPRTKKIEPAQTTIGVASTSWIQSDAARGTTRSSAGPNPGTYVPIVSTTIGTASAIAAQSRRRMSPSSGLSPSTAAG